MRERSCKPSNRCHENLGHPSNGRLITLLKAAHANELTLKLAKGLTCPTCKTHDPPLSHPISKEKRAWSSINRCTWIR